MIPTSSWPRGSMTARRTFRLRHAVRSRPPSGRRPSRGRASACPRGGHRCPSSSPSPAPPRSSRWRSARLRSSRLGPAGNVGGPANLPTSAPPVTTTAPASPSAAPVVASPQVDLIGLIAFSKVTGGVGDIVVRPADGIGTGQVVTMPGHDVEPAWSRDNTQIAWAAEDGIRIANADGSRRSPGSPIKGQRTATRSGRRTTRSSCSTVVATATSSSIPRPSMAAPRSS